MLVSFMWQNSRWRKLTQFEKLSKLEFDCRFSRAIKERLKKQCFTPFAYFTAPKSYYPQVFTTTHYKGLPKLCPPKPHKLSEKQVSEMRNWRAMYGQSVPQKTVRNMTTKDNPGTLYATDSPTVQPLDFTVLSEAAPVPVPHRETTETFYKQSQIVCVKADSSDTSQLFIMACLQEIVCWHEEGESQSVHSRSFQSSAFHGRCREICRCKQHCSCPNLP